MNRRKKVIIISIVGLIIIAGLSLWWFFNTHATYYKYNDKWIIGRNINEVEEKYGKFDEDHKSFNVKGYYAYKSSFIMPSKAPTYYWMEYDKNGIVVKVFLTGPVGG